MRARGVGGDPGEFRALTVGEVFFPQYAARVLRLPCQIGGLAALLVQGVGGRGAPSFPDRRLTVYFTRRLATSRTRRGLRAEGGNPPPSGSVFGCTRIRCSE